MKAFRTAAIVATILFAPLGAHAVCMYNGVLSAKTTLPQEFKDSRWVVKATVLSAVDHWSDAEDSWTSYEIEVTHAYKGQPRKRLRFFTYRDSGGFYLDRPWINLPAGHDVGGEYLLFLNPIPPRPSLPTEAKGAVFVNYSCGISRPWREVTSSLSRELTALERIP
jgi:hypothetical protein